MSEERIKQIEYVAANLGTLCPIPFGEYGEDGKLIKKLGMNMSRVPDAYTPYIQSMIQNLDERRVAKFQLEHLPIALWIYQSKDNHYYVWGPVQLQEFSAEEQLLYEKSPLSKDSDYTIYRTEYKNVLAAISCFAFSVDQRLFSIHDMQDYHDKILREEHISKQEINYMLEQEDSIHSNHSYAEEVYPLELLSNGDVDGMYRYLHLRRINYPNAVNRNVTKNEEYMAVATIGILSRAAIGGGVASGDSFRLSDIFLNRIAQCNDSKSIAHERDEALIAFTKLVQKANRREYENPYVEDAKQYIAHNIFKKISLDDVADELNIRSTYLARLFSQSEHLSIGQYIRKEKIRLAQNMLKYSDRSILQISNYLSFQSQSYFGKTFKKETGMTPELYRKKYRVPGF